MTRIALTSRGLAAASFDAAVYLISAALAAWLTRDLLSAFVWPEALPYLIVGAAAQSALHLFMGVYMGLWRYTSVPDMSRILVSVFLGTLFVALAAPLLGSAFPLATLALHGLFVAFLMGGARMTFRAWQERHQYARSGASGVPVIILGAGDAGVSLVKELARSQDWRVVGFLDDDEKKQNRILHGVRVHGDLESLPAMAARMKVRHAILAMPSAQPVSRRRAIELCRAARVTPLTVNSVNNISTPARSPGVRKFDVEDLLKRDPVTIDDAGLHDLLSGQVVMVTGAGGSIGSELCLQIASFQPSLLVLFEQNEFAIYKVEQLLRDRFPELPVASVVGDIKNAARVNHITHQYMPAVIFHAAAYKHVPLMEDANCWEAIQNNVMGTYTVARAAIDYGVRKFVFVSTDKAVNPTNVMGATKRLAEMVCQALQQTTPLPKFEMVRFGNVLGSAGSVIPRFAEQIERGGPVTVTHPDMVRYFMSIPEAAQLVLQAGSMGLGGEIFVMDMGEPVRIVDLANDMIRLAERSPEEIKIVYTGLRPGEKLFEELLADDEHTRPTPHPKLRIAKAKEVHADWLPGLLNWLGQDRAPDDAEVKRDLKRWVPEYVSSVRPKLKAVPGGQKVA